MKLIEIELHNWCQYEGEHIFHFGLSDNNVVLIHADNDVGKSSLFYSIAWCLHEQQPAKWKENNWPLYPLPWFKRANIGDEIKTEVVITFEHKGRQYCARRSFVTQKTKDCAIEVDLKFLLQQQNADGNWISSSEDKLHKIFPKSVLGYFVFDAEEIEHFVNQSEKVQASVLRLLDIEYAENAVTHLQKVAADLHKEFKKKNSNKAIELEQKIEAVEKSLEEAKDLLDNPNNGLKANLELKRTQRKLVEDNLFKFKDVHALLEEEKSIETSMSQNKEERLETLKKLRQLTTGLYISLIQPVAQNVFQFLEEKRKKGELPKNIKSTFVDERIKIGKCICGTRLVPGEEPHNEICLFRDTLSDELSDISHTLNNGLVAIKGKAVDQKNQLNSFLLHIANIKESLAVLQQRLSDVRSKIQRRDDIPQVPELQRQKEQCENEENALIKRIASVELELERKNYELEELNRLLRIEIKMQQESSVAERMWVLATMTSEALQKSIASFKSKAREYLERQCNLIGRELFWREDVYTMHIDDQYLISVTSPEYGEQNLLAGMSMGITQMTGLALIAALARQTQAQAPLIMDTPFARLSPAHITRALSECPKHFQQWILFLQPSEWRDSEYRKVLGSRIQKEFTLKRDNNTGKTVAVDGYHKEFFGKTKE